MTTVQFPSSAGIMSRSLSLRRPCKAPNSSGDRFEGGIEALVKICEIWDLKAILSSSGYAWIPSSTPGTISAVGIFLERRRFGIAQWFAGARDV